MGLVRASTQISFGAISNLIATTIIQTLQFAHQIVSQQMKMISILYQLVYLVAHVVVEQIYLMILALLASNLKTGMIIDVAITNFYTLGHVAHMIIRHSLQQTPTVANAEEVKFRQAQKQLSILVLSFKIYGTKKTTSQDTRLKSKQRLRYLVFGF